MNHEKICGTVKSVDLKTTHSGRHWLKIGLSTKKGLTKAYFLLGHLEPFMPGLLVGRKAFVQGEHHGKGFLVRQLQVAR